MAKKHDKPLSVEDPLTNHEVVETSEEEERPLASQKTNKKRPSVGTSSTSSKAKQEEKNPPICHRLWSEHDEIVLLQGVIDFGKCPFEDKEEFHRWVEGLISIEASTNQIIEKIRSLKRKFTGNEQKDVKPFRKAHDETCFEISKHIWGPNGIDVKTKKNETSKKKKEKVVEEEDSKVALILGEDWFERSYVVGSIAGFGIDEETVMVRWKMAPMEEKKKIEEDWRALKLEEMRFLSLKTEFLHEVTEMLK